MALAANSGAGVAGEGQNGMVPSRGVRPGVVARVERHGGGDSDSSARAHNGGGVRRKLARAWLGADERVVLGDSGRSERN